MKDFAEQAWRNASCSNSVWITHNDSKLIRWLPTQQFIILAEAGGAIRILSESSRSLLQVCPPCTPGCDIISLMPLTSESFISVGRDSVINLWQLTQGAPAPSECDSSSKSFFSIIARVAASSHGLMIAAHHCGPQRLCTACSDGLIKIWQVAFSGDDGLCSSITALREVVCPELESMPNALSCKGSCWICITDSIRIILIDCGSLKQHIIPLPEAHKVSSLAIDLNCLVAGFENGHLDTWALDSESRDHPVIPKHSSRLHSGPVTGVSLCSRSSVAVTIGVDGAVVFSNTTTGSRLTSFSPPSAPTCITSQHHASHWGEELLYSSSFVVTGHANGDIIMWDAVRRSKLNCLQGHFKSVSCIHADRSTCITSGPDSTLRQWRFFNDDLAKQESDAMCADIKRSNDARSLGNAAFKQRNFVASLMHYNEAIEACDIDPRAFTNRAACRLHRAEFNECLSDCRHALQLLSSHAARQWLTIVPLDLSLQHRTILFQRIWSRMASCHIALNDGQSARTVIELALEVAGAGCDELALQSQLDHALEIIAIKNESALAEALIAQGDIRSAINCYQKLLASVKKSDPAPFVKAKEAAAAFLQASETNPKDDSTHLPTNSKLEYSDAAALVAPATSSSDASHSDPCFLRASSRECEIPTIKSSASQIDQVLTCESPFIYSQRIAAAASERARGLAMYYGRKNQKAVEHFTNAVRMNPDDPLHLYHRAAAQQCMGLTTLAVQDIEAAYDFCNRSSISPHIHVKIISRAAKLLQARAGPNGFKICAARDWRVACVLWSHAAHISSAFNLPKHSVFARHHANAVSVMQKCYKLDIALEECANGDRYLADRNNAAAIVHYNKAVALDPDGEHQPGGENLYIHRAFCRLGLGDAPGALADANLATQLHPKVQANWMGLASIEDKHGGHGSLRRSILHAARGLDFLPNNVDLCEHLLSCFLTLIEESVIQSGSVTCRYPFQIFFCDDIFFVAPPPPVEELNALCSIAGRDVLSASLKSPCISKILEETRAVT
jgi:tetratricopeptide (TPR) repeat protein